MTRRGALLLTLLVLGACAGEDPPRSVVLISVDTLRPDHMSVYGYERDTTPELAGFFADGAIFERAYSTAASTPPAVVSLLTGRLPQDHGVRTFYQLLPEATVTLADRLRGSHQSAGFVSNSVLVAEALGLAGRFDHWDDRLSSRIQDGPFEVERVAAATTDAVLGWLDEGREPGRPLFLWVHYMDPHGPYTPPSAWDRFEHEGRVPVEPARMQRYQRDPGSSDALDWVDRYDGEIAYADAEIGRLLEGVVRRESARPTLFVLAADHGETLLERQRWFRHRSHVWEEMIRVPLLLRGPGVEAGRRREPVSLVDVVPTVLGFLGLSWEDLEGRDLRRPAPAERTLFAEASTQSYQWRAAVRGPRKRTLRLPIGEREPDRRHAWDLARDPGERRPEAWAEADALGLELLGVTARDPDPGGLPVSNPVAGARRGDPTGPADAEARERLRALGYLE